MVQRLRSRSVFVYSKRLPESKAKKRVVRVMLKWGTKGDLFRHDAHIAVRGGEIMSGKYMCIKRVGVCIACLVLTINLVCTSYTRVEAAPVAGYAIETVVGALLAALGIYAASGVTMDKAGLVAKDAEKIMQSIYTSVSNFSHATDEMIDQTIMGAIAGATETGKIIFKEGSKAWDALKAWAKSVGADIAGLLKPETGDAAMNHYNFKDVTKIALASYILAVVSSKFAAHGYSWTSDDVNRIADELSNMGADAYYVAFYRVANNYGTLFVDNTKFTESIEVMRFDSYEYLLQFLEKVPSWYNDADTQQGYYANWYSDFVFVPDSAYMGSISRWGYIGGKVMDLQILSPADMRVWQKYGTSDLAMDNAYQTVYNPAIPDTTDVVTPSNTITREEDDSVAVAGDYVIDVALPVAFPVDLTKGIVIDRDIPIEDAIDRSKTDEKTDEKTDPAKPSKPNLPTTVVDGLMVDLKSIFPFCIPFDLINCIKGLSAEGEAPKWVMKIPMPTGYTWTITVDMADYDSVVRIFRLGEDLLFIVGLIMITRSLMIRG